MNRLLLIVIAIAACSGCHQSYRVSPEVQSEANRQQDRERSLACWRQLEEEEKCKTSQRLWFRDNSTPLKHREIIWTIRFKKAMDGEERSEGPFWFNEKQKNIYHVVSGSGRRYQLRDDDIDWESRYINSKSSSIAKGEEIWLTRKTWSHDWESYSEGPFWVTSPEVVSVEAVNCYGTPFRLYHDDIDWRRRHNELMEKKAHG